MTRAMSRQEVETYLQFADLALPRHTSYPSAAFWQADWSEAAHRASLAATTGPQSLYVHVPFCSSLCFYCGCTREIIPPEARRREDPSEPYLATLAKELRAVGEATGRRTLSGIHLGGGTPTFLSAAQLRHLMDLILRHFDVEAGAELAVEVDPRHAGEDRLATLRSLGFNRLSLGIQDFDARVQQAVGRIQSYELVERVVAEARRLKFLSVNFDLIYGLPWQTEESMRRTLDQVVALSPDRIAFYRLAVLPELFRWQRAFSRADLPSGESSLALMLQGIEHFSSAGYRFLGLDHFAKPNDPLARAHERGELGRTFQGMTTGRGEATIGVGPSAISTHGDGFAQNARDVKTWTNRVEASGFATARGHRLTEDDRWRGELVQAIYGCGEVDVKAWEESHGIPFRRYFQDLLPAIDQMQTTGLLTWQGDRITLTPRLGRLLTRVVASAFDAYLPRDAWRVGMSSGGSKVG